jgi:phenylalanyl-tRNA synthetase beta chain
MQLPESWLREFCNPPLSSQQLADALTMAGLEVEELRTVAPAFSGVVVGQIIAIEPHPKADRLRVCQVDVGAASSGPLQIVCGAPNAALGLKVPCAMLGAVLPGADGQSGMEIKAVKLMGLESFGMLCSAKELQISDEQAGLLVLDPEAQLGVSIREQLNLDDHLLTLKLTPNLAHCLSVHGVAREVSAITRSPLTAHAIGAVTVGCEDRLEVLVDAGAHDLCGRFSGRVVKGLNPQAKTPQWMVDQLMRCGQRSVSALVDISNFVMFEFGQPTHIFDLDKISGPLQVRWAKPGETLELLNGQTVKLDAHVGVIADAQGIESLAGIMGGQASAVGDSTTNIYIEAAFWWPAAVAGRSRQFNFSTDAGHRFERGVDPAQTVAMIERITQLVIDICGTPQSVCGPVDDQILNLPKPQALTLRVERACRVIGMDIDQETMFKALASLGLKPEQSPGLITLTPPSHRFDLSMEEDLIEEVIRCLGYETLPQTPPLGPITAQLPLESQRGAFALRRTLASLGYQETINYSFVQEQWERSFSKAAEPIVLLNPIASSMNVMRTTLLGGLLQVLKFNVDRKMSDVRIFEMGRVFIKDASVQDSDQTVKGIHQPMRLGGLAYGRLQPLQWAASDQGVDFFDVKGDLESFLHPLELEWRVSEREALHPGRSAEIFAKGHSIGWLGELHPALTQAWDLPKSPIVFELDLHAVSTREVPSFTEVSKFQGVERDLALVLSQEVTHARLMQEVWSSPSGGFLKDATLFDLYRPKEGSGQMGLNERSWAVRLSLSKEGATLTEPEIEACVASVLAHLTASLGARLRA